MTRIVPNSIVSGDSWTTTYTPTNQDYAPSNGWTLTLALRGESVADFTATTVDNTYKFDLSNTQLSLIPGVYIYTVYLSNTGKRITVDTGNVNITPDVTATVIGTDNRTHEAKMLALIEKHLELRAIGQIDHLLTTIDGKTLQRMNTNDVLDLRNRYRSMVQRQNAGLWPKAIKYWFQGAI